MPTKSSSSNEQVVEIDPLLIYFTFSRIRPRFSCGRTIESTLQQFRNRELQPTDLPLLSVLTDGTDYFSQNNRRLYTYKQLKREGLLEVVPVRLRPFPQTKRMQSKYTPATCSLTATLMRDVEKSGAVAAASGSAAKTVTTEEPSDEDGAAAESENAREDEGEDECVRGSSVRDGDVLAVASTSPSQALSQETAKNADEDEAENGLSRQQKKPQQKNKKARQQQQQQQQQRGSTKKGGGRKEGGHDSDDEDAGISSLEAELRKLGLQ